MGEATARIRPSDPVNPARELRFIETMHIERWISKALRRTTWVVAAICTLAMTERVAAQSGSSLEARPTKAPRLAMCHFAKDTDAFLNVPVFNGFHVSQLFAAFARPSVSPETATQRTTRAMMTMMTMTHPTRRMQIHPCGILSRPVPVMGCNAAHATRFREVLLIPRS